MKLSILFVLFLSPAFAGDVIPQKEFLVKSVGDNDISSLEAPGVKILPAHRKVANSSQLPSVADRDRIFEESGLAVKMKDWDDFEKDSIYLKLTKKGKGPVDRVLMKYPDLDRATLEATQALIAKENAQ